MDHMEQIDEFRRAPEGQSLHLNGVTIEGDLDLGGLSGWNQIKLTRCTVNGSVNLEGASGVNLKIDGHSRLTSMAGRGLALRGDLCLFEVVVADDVCFENVDVNGRLDIIAVECPDIRLDNAVIRGTMMCHHITTNDFSFAGGQCHAPDAPDYDGVLILLDGIHGTPPRVRASGSEFACSLEIGPWYDRGSGDTLETVSLAGANLRADLTLRGNLREALVADGLVVGGHANLGRLTRVGRAWSPGEVRDTIFLKKQVLPLLDAVEGERAKDLDFEVLEQTFVRAADIERARCAPREHIVSLRAAANAAKQASHQVSPDALARLADAVRGVLRHYPHGEDLAGKTTISVALRRTDIDELTLPLDEVLDGEIDLSGCRVGTLNLQFAPSAENEPYGRITAGKIGPTRQWRLNNINLVVGDTNAPIESITDAADAVRGWLPNSGNARFTPSPWYEVAAVMDEGGLSAEARRISVEAADHALKYRLPWWGQPWRMIKRFTVGHGFSPFRVLGWVGLVYLASLVVTAIAYQADEYQAADPGSSPPGLWRVLFALDNTFVPVSTGQADRFVIVDPILTFILWVLRVCAWVLLAIFASAATGLLNRSVRETRS